jgi:trk system potassium uptake protein TrkA
MSADLRVVIVGGEHVGFHAARRLDARGHDVVVIEKDEDRVEYISDQYVATVIHGDGGRPPVLREADLERADVLASLTDYGAMTNIGICMTAAQIAPELRTVARIGHGTEAEYEEMVDAVVYPEQLAAHAATNKVLAVAGGGVRTIEQVTEDLELVEMTVAADAPVAGRQLSEVSFPRGAVVVAASAEEEFPGPDTVLRAGERYVLAVQTAVSDEVTRLMRG